MATSCIYMSSAAVRSSSVAPAVASTKSRQPVALCCVGVSAPAACPLVVSVRESAHIVSGLGLSKSRRGVDLISKSYGGYGAESVGKEDWSAPPPPTVTEPEPTETTPSSDSGSGFGSSAEGSFGSSDGGYGYRSEPAPNNKLYVGNIAWDVDSNQLAQAFTDNGINDLEEVNVMYDRMLGKSRGFAFVTLSTEEAAKEAIEKLDGYELNGRPLRVNYPQVPRGAGGFNDGFSRPSIPQNPAKCFVANIPWGVDDQSLSEFMSSEGTVVDCRILTDAETGRSRGIGFVTYSSPDEAAQAISRLDGAELQGRPIRVAMATGR